jgi:hypothetical protein
MRCEIKGIYPVDAAEPCHLMEAVITEHAGPVDMMQFAQEVSDEPRANWQAAWDERLLDVDGTKDIGGRFPRKIVADSGPIRVAFFIHYLDPTRPFMTPAGAVDLPPVEPRPPRLSLLQYESPG